MTIKKIILACATLSFSLMAYAHSNPDEVSVCYHFSGDKLEKKEVCIVSSGGGAGGVYENISIGDKSYLFEGACNMQGDCEYFWENQPVTSYLRNGEFHNVISQVEAQLTNNLLYCYKNQSGSLNLCTN